MNFEQLLLEDSTKNNLINYLTRPNQNLILYGPAGSGKRSLALAIISQILNISIEKIIHDPRVLILDNLESSGIESVLAISQFLKLKSNFNQVISRIVLIENLDNYSVEAKNALLKTLEENIDDSLIIMTVNNLNLIPPTIRSRTINIEVKKVDLDKIKDYFINNFENDEIERIYRLSDGLVGLMNRLLNDSTKGLELEARDLAAAYLTSDNRHKVVLTQQLMKDKVLSLIFFKILQQMSILKLSQKINPKDQKQWINILKKSSAAIENINQNIQLRLIILKFNSN
jgi:DNA polymerase III delta prime subunit